MPKRQDIQDITITTEHLYILLEVMTQQYKSINSYQMENLVEIAYLLSVKVNSWAVKEEKIVLEIEEQQRNGKRN
ncbi:hypothetical protein NGJ69_04195 [Atlantibacter hermannii]|uniref:hypothetical protein n=1 Tax=Atlantibacter hermannii TaxID=565 RepID=UPI00124C2D80|nr:hypothetical protein [Atlantibacter hermannii]MEB7922927.1 hypothetical protein [Atlantibacter hermannii]QFH70928.1 hypothetical protein FR762_14895 [Enterobacter sp. E76]